MERTARAGGTAGTAAVPAALARRRTNHSYYSTHGRFASSPDEVVVGLGQRSMVSRTPEAHGGPGGGQTRLNQKGFSWPLGVTKYQVRDFNARPATALAMH